MIGRYGASELDELVIFSNDVWSIINVINAIRMQRNQMYGYTKLVYRFSVSKCLMCLNLECSPMCCY